jgi:hypothetical protein
MKEITEEQKSRIKAVNERRQKLVELNQLSAAFGSTGDTISGDEGLTKLEYFSVRIMQALIISGALNNDSQLQDVTCLAAEIADQLLEDIYTTK